MRLLGRPDTDLKFYPHWWRCVVPTFPTMHILRSAFVASTFWTVAIWKWSLNGVDLTFYLLSNHDYWKCFWISCYQRCFLDTGKTLLFHKRGTYWSKKNFCNPKLLVAKGTKWMQIIYGHSKSSEKLEFSMEPTGVMFVSYCDSDSASVPST